MPAPGFKTADACSVEGCSAPYYSKGFCSLHYGRWRRHGDALKTETGGHYSTIREGDRFGRLVVVRREPGRPGRAYFLCRCDCGAEARKSSQSLRGGRTLSCGCLISFVDHQVHTRHGHASASKRSPTWNSWQSMRRRCLSPGATGYEHWGGRGITICKRWDSFEHFLADMGERPPGTSLDRIDRDGNYEPANCRWATAASQTQNQSARKLSMADARRIRERKAGGETQADLARSFDVSPSTIHAVVRNRIWREVDAA